MLAGIFLCIPIPTPPTISYIYQHSRISPAFLGCHSKSRQAWPQGMEPIISKLSHRHCNQGNCFPVTYWVEATPIPQFKLVGVRTSYIFNISWNPEFWTPLQVPIWVWGPDRTLIHWVISFICALEGGISVPGTHGSDTVLITVSSGARRLTFLWSPGVRMDCTFSLATVAFYLH